MSDAPEIAAKKRTCAKCKYDMTGISSPTCPECGYTAPLPRRACTSCGYDLTGAASDTCPECGYTPTLEEIALAERRATFCELLWWRQWWSFFWPVAPYLLLWFNREMRVMAGSAAVLTALSLMWGEIAGRQMLDVPRGQLRTARTVWRVSLRWLHLPICGPGYALIGLAVLAQLYRALFFGWLQFDAWETPAMICGAGAGLLGTWPAWWYASRRLLRSSGLTAEYRDPKRFAKAARWALRPQGVLIAIPVVFYAIMEAIDALFPNWWR